MKKWVYFAVLLLGATVCVCLIALNVGTAAKSSSAARELERSRKAMADLEEQVREARSQRNSANQKVEELEREVSALIEQQKADRLVIEDLWNMLLRNRRTEGKGIPAEQEAVKPDQEQGVQHDTEEDAVKYDAEAVRKMISAGGGLEGAIRQIVTSEGIDSTLQAHNEEPAYWAAAASLAQDKEAALKYLEEAVSMHPDSAIALSSLVEANIAQGQTDESVLVYIDELKRIDPANALADAYAAYCQFNNGDIAGALQSLAQAGAKDRFADDTMDLMMARYDYFLDGGASDSMAIGLSAFGLPLSHMGMLREIGEHSMEQARSLSAAGQHDDSLQIAQNVSNLGASLSSSGRFIVYDRVGIAMQKSALEQQRQIYEGKGDTRQVREIDVQLQAIDERSLMIDVMAQTFGAVMQRMTDQDIADYVDGTVLNGEFSTLQDIPEIAEALAQAQTEQAGQPAEVNTP
ncbi:MAG: tetratricopeptide repeat protein [Planctomycetota bacterium]|jgi:tetratricopeptide (TPR) repeat protein